MAGRAKYDTKNAQNAQESYEDLKAWAIKAYEVELAKANGNGTYTVAKDSVRRSQAEANVAWSWLTDNITEVIIEYISEVGNQGFPLSHCRLKEHMDQILQAQLGERFLASDVGKQWTNHFIKKYSSKICHSQLHSSQNVDMLSIHIPKMPGSCCCNRPSQIIVSRWIAHMALMRLDVTQQRPKRSASWGVLNLAHRISNVTETRRTLPLL